MLLPGQIRGPLCGACEGLPDARASSPWRTSRVLTVCSAASQRLTLSASHQAASRAGRPNKAMPSTMVGTQWSRAPLRVIRSATECAFVARQSRTQAGGRLGWMVERLPDHLGVSGRGHDEPLRLDDSLSLFQCHPRHIVAHGISSQAWLRLSQAAPSPDVPRASQSSNPTVAHDASRSPSAGETAPQSPEPS